MKTDILNRLKSRGYRKNSKGFEGFKLVNGLRFYIKVKQDDVVFKEKRYFVEFGVAAPYPFISEGKRYSIILMRHSIKYNELFYGGELNDFWREDQLDELWLQIEKVSIPWIDEMSTLTPMEDHIKWKIENGILFLNSPQRFRHENELGESGKEITKLMSNVENHVNYSACKRYYLYLALIAEARRDKECAIYYILQYIDYLKDEQQREAEVEEIERSLKSESWPEIT